MTNLQSVQQDGIVAGNDLCGRGHSLLSAIALLMFANNHVGGHKWTQMDVCCLPFTVNFYWTLYRRSQKCKRSPNS